MNLNVKNFGLKVGCFLTGYSLPLISRSSEASVRRLKRYISGLIIICLMWAFVGFAFSERYLRFGFLASSLAAILSVIVVVQVERQIILSPRNRWLTVFRMVLGVAMALIGSTIVDQMIFREDIELRKPVALNEKIAEAMPGKTEVLRKQINHLDSMIQNKDAERKALVDEVSKQPKIRAFETESETVMGKDSIPVKTTKVRSILIDNPKLATIVTINNQIYKLDSLRQIQDALMLNLRADLEQELSEKLGFLDELELMVGILTESGVALTVWLLWLIMLICLELFIVVSKSTEERTDYDDLLDKQSEIHRRKIALLDGPSS